MYVLSPYPNILYALDLSQPGAPLKWQYNPKPEAASQGVACCDTVNRGPTYANGRIFYTTLDAHVVAVDADTGQEVWNTKLGEINRGETMTMAPLVAKDKVVVGISGGEYGVRGWIEALDAKSGKSVWKAYSTGPDQDVKIGPNFKPFYNSDKGKDLGVTSWPPNAWERAAGRCGASSPTIPTRTSSITEPPTPARGIRISVRATTSGPPACSPATSTPARRAGSTNTIRTTCTIGTASTSTC